MQQEQEAEVDLDLSSSTWTSTSSEEEVSDPEQIVNKLLDLRSPFFNAGLALKCVDIDLPIKNAPKYKSLTEFKKLVPNFAKPKKRFRDKSAKVKTQPRLPSPQKTKPQPSTTSESTPKASTSSSSLAAKPDEQQPFYPIPGRRFLAHQLPVLRPRKQKPNVLTLMDAVEGPLSALNKARVAQRRIKVWTKNKIGIRGYCTGYLEGFDKHWNLILTDVDEKFQRKRHIKTPAKTKVELDAEESRSFKSGELLTSYSKRKSGHQTTSADQKPSRSRSKRTSIEDDIEFISKGIQTTRLANDFNGGTVTTLRLGLSKFIPNAREMTDDKISQAQLRKKRLVILKKPLIDFHGNYIVAQSLKYEIVQRRIRQLFLMGDEVVHIETMTGRG